VKELDAVSLGIMWDRLIAITNEALSALVRTSFSTNVREAYDLSVMLFDARGRSIAQADFSMPSFTGTGPFTVGHVLDRFPPETLRPGDVLANDPWLGTGHVYDINVLRPIFRDERLIGYALSITHLPDIGGLGYSTIAREIYEEGLRLPVCKLVKEGVANQELLDLIAVNVRTPEHTLGDLHANIACTAVGGRLLFEFMDEYGISDLQPIADAIVESSENAIREKIQHIPDGRYGNRIQVEAREQPVTLACTVAVEGDGIHIDLAGTSSVVPMGINVPIAYSRAFAVYTVKCITVPNLPNNIGCVTPVRVTAPDNCILNALPPNPTGGRHAVGHFVSPLLYGALVKAVPEFVQADSGMQNLIQCQGTHRDGRPLSAIIYSAGGFGAVDGKDGPPTIPSPSNMIGAPVEVWESITSMRIDTKALVTDSGGAGKHRGGLGQEIALVNDTGYEMAMSCFGMRTEYPALGMLGGRPGALRRLQVNGASVDPKGRHVLKPGDLIEVVDSGGGGFGDPFKRDPEEVFHDVLEGAVSQEAAARDYGVAIDLETGTAQRPCRG
jgi:N-methylhydantoinase B